MDKQPENQREQMIYMMSKTIGSSAMIDEMNKNDRCFDLVWKEMTPTDIPKLFISSSAAYHTKEDFVIDGIPAESLLNVWVLPTSEKKSDDAIYEEALRLMEQRRTEWAEPYYEKLGNCKVVELPGDHVIFLDKPDECSRIIKEFIDGLCK